MPNLEIPQRVLDGDFAGWLRDAIESRGVSPRMVALQAGVDHTTIYRLMGGERLPSLATALALIRVLERPDRVFPRPSDGVARSSVTGGDHEAELPAAARAAARQ